MQVIHYNGDERPRQTRSGMPDSVVLTYEGVTYRVDLKLCRQRLVELKARGEIANRSDFAKRAGVSRSTLSRFLHGRIVSLKALHGILTALDLRFSEVVSVVSPC